MKNVLFPWSFKKAFFAVLGLLVLGGVIGAIASGVISSEKKTSAPEIVKQSSDDPDESEINDDNYTWKGKANDPKYITMNSIKAKGYIQKVTVDQRNEVGVPSNVNLAGYFVKSSRPGANGLSIIDGHIDGKTKPGIFYKLSKSKKGQTFTIEFGNGSTKKFKITGVTQVPKNQAASVLFSQDPQNVSQLNLITCGGDFNRKAHHYDDRIIVTSVPA